MLPLPVLIMTIVAGAYAQTSRSSVSVAEITGTFRYTFGAKYKKSSSDIKIASAGKGKIHVAMELIYPYIVKGDLMANTGELDGMATINGDTAVYESSEFGQCKITLKFAKPGVLLVTQQGSDADCGFGHNVMADGTYRKVSSAKPKMTGTNQN